MTEERALKVLRLGLSGRNAAFGALLKLHAPVIAMFAYRVSIAHSVAEKSDLIVVGEMAILRAAERFEPSRGLKFITYLYRCVRGEMIRSLRPVNFYPQWLVDAAAKDGRTLAQPVQFGQLETDGYCWVSETLADPDQLDAIECIAQSDVLSRRLAALTDGERHVITERIFNERTFDDIAAELGMTRSAAHVRYKQGLAHIRRGLAPEMFI